MGEFNNLRTLNDVNSPNYWQKVQGVGVFQFLKDLNPFYLIKEAQKGAGASWVPKESIQSDIQIQKSPQSSVVSSNTSDNVGTGIMAIIVISFLFLLIFRRR